MSGRHRGELQFGSDSFLDVVCNIVGVLIILLVMAGMRANQVPVVLPDEDVQQEMPAVSEPITPEPAPLPLLADTAGTEMPPPAPVMAPQTEEPIEEEPLPPLEPPPQFVAAAESLNDEIQSLRRSAGNAKQKLTEAHESLENLEQRLQAAKELFERKAAEATVVKQQQAATTSALDSLRANIAQLQGQLREAQSQPPAAGSQIEHRITPMSRVISGEDAPAEEAPAPPSATD